MHIASVQKIEVLSRHHYRPICGSPAPKTGDCTRRQTGKGGRPRCPQSDRLCSVRRQTSLSKHPFNALTYQPKKVWHDDSCRDPRTPPKRGSRGFSIEVKTENFDHQKTSYSNVHVHVMRFISKPHICLTVSHRWSGFNMDSECVGQTLWAGSLFWNIYAWLDGVRWKLPAFLQLKYVFIWRWRHQHPPFQICKLRGMKEDSNTTLLSPYQNWRSRRSKHTHQPKKNSHTWSK